MQELIEQWKAAKAAEEGWKEERHRLEEKIADLLGRESEGTKSVTEHGHKVTATFGVSRSVDAEKFAQVAGQLPPEIAANIVKMKPSLDTKGFRWLEENRPDLFRIFASCVTTKPRKVSIKITEAK